MGNRYQSGDAGQVHIAGADSFLTAAALNTLQNDERMLTSRNSNGFIPGEAGLPISVTHLTGYRPEG